jgi:DivIVA domain-containing protein
MSATNLDLPVLISADQIRRREFVTTRRGYDPGQVRAYLEQLADQIELMRVLLREAQQEAQTAIRTSAAQQHEDPYEKLAQRVAGVIREADLAADAIRTEAATDAERLAREARADADRIRTAAQAKAEEARSRADEAVRAAREEADRTIAGLSTRRDALVEQLASMQDRLIGVARDLETAMDVHVTLPAIQSFDELFDEPDETKGPESPAPSNGGSVWAGTDQDDTHESSADETDRPILIGEAEATYDHAPEEKGPLMDPSYEELWDRTDGMKLDMPDIPALDLDWGQENDEPS